MNCQYCDRAFEKGGKMHERYCKENPTNLKEPTTEPEPIDASPAEKPKNSNRNRIYYLLCSVFIVAGFLQYLIISFFKIHWLYLVILWAIDLFILVFLLWTVYKLRKKQEPIVFKDIEDFVKQVPKWTIDEKSPKAGLIGSVLNKGKDYKQLVLVSENFEPKAVWAEWDGFLFRIGNRAYKPARDVRGDIFLYHVDKKMALIDSAEATQEDAEDSYHLLAVWNQAFSVGHAAAEQERLSDIKMLKVLVGCILVVVVGLSIYQYGQFGEIQTKLAALDKAIAVLAQSNNPPP